MKKERRRRCHYGCGVLLTKKEYVPHVRRVHAVEVAAYSLALYRAAGARLTPEIEKAIKAGNDPAYGPELWVPPMPLKAVKKVAHFDGNRPGMSDKNRDP